MLIHGGEISRGRKKKNGPSCIIEAHVEPEEYHKIQKLVRTFAAYKTAKLPKIISVLFFVLKHVWPLAQWQHRVRPSPPLHFHHCLDCCLADFVHLAAHSPQ
jgi:hypothetical protein